MGADPLMALKASSIVLNWIQAATGGQWRFAEEAGSHKNQKHITGRHDTTLEMMRVGNTGWHRRRNMEQTDKDMR